MKQYPRSYKSAQGYNTGPYKRQVKGSDREKPIPDERRKMCEDVRYHL